LSGTFANFVWSDPVHEALEQHLTVKDLERRYDYGYWANGKPARGLAADTGTIHTGGDGQLRVNQEHAGPQLERGMGLA
jgi:hypothetical protein